MHLKQFIHGYTDSMLDNLDRQTVLSIQREADQDFARRTAPGSIIVLLLLVTASLISDISIDSPLLYYSLLSVSALTVVIHAFHVRSLDRRMPESLARWETGYALLMLVNSAYWGTFSARVLTLYGIDSASLVYLLILVGVTSGIVSSMFIWKRLLQACLTVLLLPTIVVLVGMKGVGMATGLGLGFAIFLAFLYLQAHRSNKEYWQALINTRKLEAQAQELERANNAKSEFLSSMSHELRTPLNAILGFGQLIKMDAQEEAQIENVGEILKAGSHLLSLINEILDLSRIESGRMEMSPENCHLNEIIEECVHLLQPMMDRRSLVLRNLIDADRDYIVLVDFTRFKQVVLNLLSNAVKYNDSNGSVTISTQDVDDTMLRVSISDTGQGMSEQQQQKLFAPFVRLEQHHDIDGTGIGLTITRRLVELMGGRIGIESEEGKGSTFWVEIPLGKVERQMEKETASAPVPGQVDEYAETAPKTILYIEDNPANLKLVATLLKKRSPHRLISAPDASIGLSLVESQQPDLVLMDINLPGMDGYAALQRLQENNATRHIPVIAVSANATRKDLEKGMDAGFERYISKPINVTDLLQQVNEVLNP